MEQRALQCRQITAVDNISICTTLRLYCNTFAWPAIPQPPLNHRSSVLLTQHRSPSAKKSDKCSFAENTLDSVAVAHPTYAAPGSDSTSDVIYHSEVATV